MMKSFLVIAVLLFGAGVHAQQLSQVTFSYYGDLLYFTFMNEQGVLIRVSPDGQLLEYGSEEASLRNSNYYNPKLMPYPGRVEMYNNPGDSASYGKVKNIGFTSLRWYAQFETKFKAGKLQAVGRTRIDYYDNFADKSLQGKIKNIDNQTVDYYASLSDNDAYRGKLKAVGTTAITYYSSFDDRAIRGKLKSIGPTNFSWYTSFDINRSGLKSGLYRTLINGVTYVMR
ncbi:hypothetical protein BH10BAC3_BH10BAC3_09160 [soil metagenome]